MVFFSEIGENRLNNNDYDGKLEQIVDKLNGILFVCCCLFICLFVGWLVGWLLFCCINYFLGLTTTNQQTTTKQTTTDEIRPILDLLLEKDLIAKFSYPNGNYFYMGTEFHPVISWFLPRLDEGMLSWVELSIYLLLFFVFPQIEFGENRFINTGADTLERILQQQNELSDLLKGLFSFVSFV